MKIILAFASLVLCSCAAKGIKSHSVTSENSEGFTFKTNYRDGRTGPAIAAFRAKQHLVEVAAEEAGKRGKSLGALVLVDADLKKHPMMTDSRITLQGKATYGENWGGLLQDFSPLVLLADDASQKEDRMHAALGAMSNSLANSSAQISQQAQANMLNSSIQQNTNAINRLNQPRYQAPQTYRLTPTYGGGYRATPY